MFFFTYEMNTLSMTKTCGEKNVLFTKIMYCINDTAIETLSHNFVL